MLVPTRGIGQAIVVDDQLVATVERFNADSATLTLADMRGAGQGQLSLSRDTRLHLFLDVDVVMIKAEPEKVRLGFECSVGDSIANRIARIEHWIELNGPV